MSVMDVQIEQQVQLLSRLQLTVDCQSRLCFLHGESGVGKSYLTNMLSEQSAHYSIRLSYRVNANPGQIKQQLMCELAGDELLDLELPLLAAVRQRISCYKQSILIIVDNASELPQADIAMLWHAVHDFSRLRPCGANFSVVLVGETRWAMPLFKALDKKEQSLVAEFHLKPLSRKDAFAFMKAVHVQWPEGKIKRFLKSVQDEHLLPKQLIYAQTDTGNSKSNKQLLISLTIILFVLVISLALSAYITNPSPERSELPDKPITNAENTDSKQSNLAETANEVISEKKEIGLVEHASEKTKVIAPAHSVEQEIVPSRPIATERLNVVTAAEESTMNDIAVPKPSHKETYDAELLLAMPKTNYTLMLGGYAERTTFENIYSQFSSYSQIYQYKTIRNGNPWYVILYGSFETKAAADKALLALPEHVSGFLPWSKPYASIHRELDVFASTKTDNN